MSPEGQKGAAVMARCGSQCPYHWHDEDCEYCGARGGAVIDLEDYSYDTCPYFLEYQEQRNYARAQEKARKAASSSEGSGSGCGVILWIIIIAAVVSFCMRSCEKERQPDPPDGAQQSEASAEETPEGEPFDPDAGFIFPRSDTELIQQWEAEALSDSGLTHAINEIYARHGYIFRSAELAEYYGQFSWYIPEIPSDAFSADCFSQIEQQNLNLLVGERNSRKASN